MWLFLCPSPSPRTDFTLSPCPSNEILCRSRRHHAHDPALPGRCIAFASNTPFPSRFPGDNDARDFVRNRPKLCQHLQLNLGNTNSFLFVMSTFSDRLWMTINRSTMKGDTFSSKQGSQQHTSAMNRARCYDNLGSNQYFEINLPTSPWSPSL